MFPPLKKQRLSNEFTSFKRNFKTKMDIHARESNMEFTEDELKDASSFLDFFIDLIHNFSDKTKYFLSEDVVLDYFGHTIKGQKNVTSYIISNVINVKHLFNDAKPVEKVGFRNTHIVKLPSNRESKKKFPRPFFSPPKNNEPKTPIKSSSQQPSTSSKIEKERQKDGPHKSLCSPAKRLRISHDDDIDLNQDFLLETDIVESERDPINIKYMVTEGHLEFRKPSTKKLQVENKWKRPCKLSIGYSSTADQDFTIYLIIYEGNLRCRRNLMKEFDETK